MRRWKMAGASALAALSACGRAGASPEPEAPVPTAVAARAGPQPASDFMASESRAFADWIAVCDNGNACFAFGPGRDGLGWIRVAVQPGPQGRAQVAAGYWPEEAETVGSLALAVDGVDYPMTRTGDEPLAAEVAPEQALEAARALAGGRSARIGADHALSLSGAAAALLWIDERQGRVNTVTALRRAGPQPASSVRAAPPLPLVTPAPAVSQTGFGDQNQVLPAALEALPAVAQCRAETGEHWVSQQVMSARLDASSELWAVPCLAGAYNMSHDWYVTSAGGRDPRPAQLASTSGQPGAGTINGGYSPDSRTISAFAKGRGLGDCGTASTWTWSGDAFVLTRESQMQACWGVPAHYWPSTWRTR